MYSVVIATSIKYFTPWFIECMQLDFKIIKCKDRHFSLKLFVEWKILYFLIYCMRVLIF